MVCFVFVFCSVNSHPSFLLSHTQSNHHLSPPLFFFPNNPFPSTNKVRSQSVYGTVRTTVCVPHDENVHRQKRSLFYYNIYIDCVIHTTYFLSISFSISFVVVSCFFVFIHRLRLRFVFDLT